MKKFDSDEHSEMDVAIGEFLKKYIVIILIAQLLNNFVL